MGNFGLGWMAQDLAQSDMNLAPDHSSVTRLLHHEVRAEPHLQHVIFHQIRCRSCNDQREQAEIRRPFGWLTRLRALFRRRPG